MSETPDKVKKPSRGFFILLLLLALAAAAWVIFGEVLPQLAAYKRPLPADEPPQAQASSELQSKLDQADARIKALEDAAAAKPASDADAKIAALQAKVDVLSKQPPAGAPDAHLAALLTQQQQALQQLNARLNAVVALGDIQNAVRCGKPFSEPLATLKQAMADNAPAQALIAQLAPYAGKGAPTLPELQDEFETVIPAALASGNDGGFMRMLRGFISIRRVGEQAGNGDDAVIARAEAQLKHRNIEKATGELASLSPAAAKAFAPWTAKANETVRICRALSALQPALLKDTK